MQMEGSEAGEDSAASSYRMDIMISEMDAAAMIFGTKKTYVLVTSGNGQEDTTISNCFCGVVGHLGEGTTKGHVGDGLVGTLLLGIRGSPFHTLDDTRIGAGPVAVKNLHGNELALLSNTEGPTTNGSRDVSTMAIAVHVHVINEVTSPGGTASVEFLVLNIITGVNNVGNAALTSSAVIVVGGATRLLRADTGKAPGWNVVLLLNSVDLDAGITLNVFDLETL